MVASISGDHEMVHKIAVIRLHNQATKSSLLNTRELIGEFRYCFFNEPAKYEVASALHGEVFS